MGTQTSKGFNELSMSEKSELTLKALAVFAEKIEEQKQLDLENSKKHMGIFCDVCKAQDFENYRYKCLICDDYDLCSSCFEEKRTSRSHQPGHAVARFCEPGVLFGRNFLQREITLSNFEKEFVKASHEGLSCEVCGQNPIRGLRFSCFTCKHYNLCSWCYKQKRVSKDHQADHAMVAQGSPESLKIDPNDLEIMNHVGSGAFGSVYKAKMKSKNKIVACKMISYDFKTSPDRAEQLKDSFAREIVAYNEIKATNILCMFGYTVMIVDHRTCLALVTEFMNKGSLAEVLTKEPDISWRRRLEIAHDISCGMTRMHELNFIHRDIRPDNVLVDENYVAKIGDMGIAREYAQSGDQLTRVGCQQYMPLEFFTGAYDQKLDVFTFGITLNEMYGGTHYDLFQFGEKLKKMAPVFTFLIQPCTDKDPKKRPSSKLLSQTLQRYRNLINRFVSKHEEFYKNLSVKMKNQLFKDVCDKIFQGTI